MTTTKDRIITNKLLIEDLELEDYLFKELSYDAQQCYNIIEATLTKQLATVLAKLHDPEFMDYLQDVDYENDYVNEVFDELDYDLNELLDATRDSIDETLENIWNTGVDYGYDNLRQYLRPDEIDKRALFEIQNSAFNNIRNLSQDMMNNVKRNMWRMIASGESSYETARRLADAGLQPLPGSTLTPYQRARMIARTEEARAINKGTLQVYNTYGIEEVDINTAGDSRVCSICLYYEAHNPHKLEDAKGLIPAHPNCRCNYSAHIPDTIEEPLKPVKNPETVHTPNSRTNKKYEDLKTPEDIAEYFNLELSKKSGGYQFYDKVYDCTIRIPQAYKSRKGKQYGKIDLKNNGEGYYDLKEVIKIYDHAQPILKHATNTIYFNPREGESGVFAFAQRQGRFTTKQITINPYSLRTKRGEDGNLQQTLYHEMGHCLDYSAKSEYFILGISYSDEFKEAIQKDEAYQKTNNYPIERASSYGATNLAENWAETCAMVSFHGLGKEDMKNAVLLDYNGNNIYFEDWVVRHKYIYGYALKILNNTKVSDFNYK